MISRIFCLYGLLFFIFLIPENGFAVIRHVCFIVNPTSNNGQCERVWDSIEGALDEYYVARGSVDQAAALVGPTYEVFLTEHPDHATELAHRAYQNWQQGQHAHGDQLLIVAVGGDGTVHEVVQGLENHQQQVVIGVIPAGTGNDIARTLRLGNPMHALRSLVYGRPTPFGAYKIEGCQRGTCEKKTVLAVDEFDLGVTAQATKKKNEHDSGERPSRLLRCSPRKMVYTMSALSSAMSWRTPTVNCSIDRGSSFNIPLNLLAAGTGPTIGGGVRLFNGMRPNSDQGQLLYSLRRAHPISTLFQMTMQRLFNRSGLQQARFTQMDIGHHSQAPQNIQVDGDILLQTPAQVTWMPEVFQFMRPPEPGDFGYEAMRREEELISLEFFKR
ncbi:diacylglycerol/lipid kinase family protein [Endozoicomonas sp. 8E]|uniref:diacylglycerol/lipid kinase family protein n=1 Tax=Endozoicomonas sp. 8E TaxID=3035692 RepID=UPI0029393430|nr:diacylglycerol kinase family protein [Endozoicomonas sp. 8E]WOG28017.1 diacylglycerol kinase family protein [Endozoicomonas sp. 8E]